MTAEYPPVTGVDPAGPGLPAAGRGLPAARPGMPAAVPASTPATASAARTDPPAGADPRAALEAVRTEVGKAVVGQDSVVTGLVICLLCRGHVLLEGVPGVAKTLLIRSLAATLSLRSTRVQFTADLMPGDVTGSLIYDAKTAQFQFREGPVFTNLLLADEVNRTPPKTQAALLEAMEERQVSVEGTPRPLPEAQLDRFLVKLVVQVPARNEEIAVLARHADGFDPGDLAAAGVSPVAGAADLAAARAALRGVRIAPEVTGYIVDLARATRQSPSLRLGVSPRGATALQATSRAWAWLAGRDYVIPDDVKALARPTLRHRVQLRPEAELEGATADGVLEAVLASVPVPR